MKRREKRKYGIRRILIKAMLYAVLLATGELLAGVGGYCCIMTHLPDAVGIPLLTAGFFLIVIFACSMQDEYDRMLSARYSGQPVYRAGKKRREPLNRALGINEVPAGMDADQKDIGSFADNSSVRRRVTEVQEQCVHAITSAVRELEEPKASA